MFRTYFDSVEKIWHGINSPPVFNLNASVGNIILHSLRLTPNKIAQINANNGVKLTCNELRNQIIRAAQNIQKLGYKKGDIFAIISKNNHELAPIVFASLCLGIPMNTIDAQFSESEIVHMLKITKPKAIFCEIEIIDVARKCSQKVENNANIFTFCGSIDGAISVTDLFKETGEEHDFTPAIVDSANDSAFIVCSSGTTGLPKAVCLSHASCIDRYDAFPWINSDDVVLCFSSLYWVSGVWILLYSTMSNATRIITTEPYSPEKFLKFIEEYKVTYIFSSAYQLTSSSKCDDLSRRDLSSMKVLIAGGSRVVPEAVAKINASMTNGIVYVAYGMSEVNCFATINSTGEKHETVGRISPGLKVKIVNDDGQQLGVNETGEICVLTPTRFPGYYNDRNATVNLFDEDGYICTGDVGRFDEHGNLYMVDRKKDFIKYRNFMISPSEIEIFLLKSPEIKSVCIIGIDDQESGDLPAAAIILRENSIINENDIDELICKEFSDTRKLRGGIYFVSVLPTTPSGKLIRRKVKQQLTAIYKQKQNE